MIVLNLFIGVNIHTMNKITEKEKGAEKLSKAELDWLLIKEKIHSMKLCPLVQFKEESCRYYCEVISKSKAYKIFKFIIILTFLLRVSWIYSGLNVRARLDIFRDQLAYAFISLVCYIT